MTMRPAQSHALYVSLNAMRTDQDGELAPDMATAPILERNPE
jgi:hypothetical protein